MGDRHVEYMSLDAVPGATRNPKRHSGDIPVSMRRFGFTEPLLLDERTGRLVAGHGRLEAVRQLRAGKEEPPPGVRIDDGTWRVPVVRGWSSRSDTEADAYLLASNRLTEKGGWENEGLAELLQELDGAHALEGTGFGPEDLAALLKSLETPKDGLTDPDDVPEVDEKDVHVRPGELWALGEHRILCGDSTKPEDVARIMEKEKASICWTDPPYNLAYNGGARNKLTAEKKRAVIENDDMGGDFNAFVQAFCRGIHSACLPGAHVYLAMADDELPAVHVALQGLGFHWSSNIVWVKDAFNLSPGDYHSQHEALWYGWLGSAPRLCPLEDRTQSDVWNIARPKKSEEHPTMKPVELVTRALQNSSRPDAICFEPFSGSGTTLLACEQLGRRCRAIELAPKYVQVCIERWEAFTGKKAARLSE